VATQRIVPMGGGGFSMEPRNLRLDRWLLTLARRRKARVLFVPTASGDASHYVQRFYWAFGRLPCTPAHLPLFNRTTKDLRKLLTSQDLIYVGGGNTANLLAIWRLHGVDQALREAWHAGVVLCGVSAGALCWFEAGVTDSFGRELQPLTGGLGLLSGSFCPHYEGEATRRPAFHRMVTQGRLPSGFAADDGVALLFEGSDVADVVRSRPHVQAYEVSANHGRAVERAMPARLLPA
jgi:dipeptidase E